MIAAPSIVTLDVGVTYDESRLVCATRLAGIGALNPDHDGRPVLAARSHGFGQGAPLIDVVEATVELIVRTRPAYVAIERTGVGAMPAQEIRRKVIQRIPRHRIMWCFVHWTGEMKLACYSLLRWLFERRQIVLERDPIPLRQLAGIRVEQATHGAKIGAEDPSVHDDAADALAFLALPYVPHRSRRLVCALARLVDPATAPPEVEVPVLDEPIVETGGGLRLYRRPPMQGIADSRLYLPPGVEPRDPEHRQRPEMVLAPQPEGDR